MKPRLLGLCLGTMVAILLGIASESVFAQVKPGDMITVANASKVKDITSPGTYYKVLKGMSMKIIPTGRIDWPPPYKDATERYSAQVRLAADHRGANSAFDGVGRIAAFNLAENYRRRAVDHAVEPHQGRMPNRS